MKTLLLASLAVLAIAQAPKHRSGFSRLYHGETNIDFVGRWKLWFGISGAFLLIGMVALIVVGRDPPNWDAAFMDSQTLHRSLYLMGANGRVNVTLDIVPDEDDPHALLSARAADGEKLAEQRVEAGLKLTSVSARRWVAGGYREA